MCRNIKTLHHFEPPATEAEVRASALQYVRKLTGMNAPSKANQRVFEGEERLALGLAAQTVFPGLQHLHAELQAHRV